MNFTEADFLPPWLLVLLLGFGATAFTSMYWMARRYGVATLFGVVFGPITYLAGVRFGAAEVLVSKAAMIASYGIVWALIMVFFARFVTFEEK